MEDARAPIDTRSSHGNKANFNAKEGKAKAILAAVEPLSKSSVERSPNAHQLRTASRVLMVQ